MNRSATAPEKKTVIWLKHRLARKNHPDLFRILSGVAGKYRTDSKFCIIDMESGIKNLFTRTDEVWKVTSGKIYSCDPSENNARLLAELKKNNYTTYLAGKKLNLNEKLTKDNNLKIICIYVTVSRKTFEGMEGDNIIRCLVNLKKASTHAQNGPCMDIEWMTR